jgi:hypothetical protein
VPAHWLSGKCEDLETQKEWKQELKEVKRLSLPTKDRSADRAREAVCASFKGVRGQEGRTSMLVCQVKAPYGIAQAGSSRSQKVAVTTAAKKSKVEDSGGKGDPQTASRGQAGHPDPTI